jgi:hypothetical protein
VLLEELTWRPKYGARRAATEDTESVEQVVFAFLDDRLFQVTVDYDRQETEGLSDADMIDAISAIYGSRFDAVPARTRRAASADDDGGTPLAQWGSIDNSIVLYRLPSYVPRFRMVLTSEPSAALARIAAARALVLDAREAPGREAAREKKEAQDRRAAEEDARAANKATFRP